MDYLNEQIAAEISAEDSAMTVEEAKNSLEHLDNWELLHEESTGYHLKRLFDFADADKAREFITELEKMIEDMQHVIPNIDLKGTQVQVMCHTSKLEGLHRNDFIMAAHADELYERWDILTGERDKVTEASDESFPASDPPAY